MMFSKKVNVLLCSLMLSALPAVGWAQEFSCTVWNNDDKDDVGKAAELGYDSYQADSKAQAEEKARDRFKDKYKNISVACEDPE